MGTGEAGLKPHQGPSHSVTWPCTQPRLVLSFLLTGGLTLCVLGRWMLPEPPAPQNRALKRACGTDCASRSQNLNLGLSQGHLPPWAELDQIWSPSLSTPVAVSEGPSDCTSSLTATHPGMWLPSSGTCRFQGVLGGAGVVSLPLP